MIAIAVLLVTLDHAVPGREVIVAPGDCPTAMRTWLEQAQSWAVRSHLPTANGPLCLCHDLPFPRPWGLAL